MGQEKGQATRPLQSDWRFLAVDVKKKVKPDKIAFALSAEDVQMIVQEQDRLPLFLGEGDQQVEIKVVKLSDMQTAAPPGWWDNSDQYAKHCADTPVVVQQRVKPNAEGKRPWRLIVRVPKSSIWDTKLWDTELKPEVDEPSNVDWSTDMLAPYSTVNALFKIGHPSGGARSLPAASGSRDQAHKR